MSKPAMGPPCNEEVVVRISGAELMTLQSAVFMLHLWDFEHPSARVMRSSRSEEELAAVNNCIFVKLRRFFADAGFVVPAPGPLTQESATQRSLVRGEIWLTKDQFRTCVLALKVCYEEFLFNWTDFCVASPGDVRWYCRDPKELLGLAENLKEYLHPAQV